MCTSHDSTVQVLLVGFLQCEKLHMATRVAVLRSVSGLLRLSKSSAAVSRLDLGLNIPANLLVLA